MPTTQTSTAPTSLIDAIQKVQLLADTIAANYAARAGKVPYLPKTAVVVRRKYILIDRFLTNNQQSGMFVVDPATGEVFNISKYGRPNRRIGTIESLITEWETETGRS